MTSPPLRSFLLALALVIPADVLAAALTDSWTSASLADAASFLRVTVCASQPSRLYASGDGGGVYRSEDHGVSWVWVGEDLPLEVAVSALAASPDDDDIVFAGLESAALYRSLDAGVTWHLSDAGLSGQPVRSLAFDGSDPPIVYAATGGGVGRGVYRSTDGGDTWEARSEGLLAAVVQDVAIDPADPAVLLAATTDGIARSTDAGASWVWVEIGYGVSAIAWSPAAPEVVRAIRAGTLLSSTDAGVTWRPQASLYSRALAVSPNDADHLLATSSQACGWSRLGSVPCGYPYEGSRVTSSTDGGDTWDVVLSTCDCSLPGDVTFDPSGSGYVYVASFGSGPGLGAGMRRSSAGGAAGSWEHSSAGLHHVAVQDVDVGADDTIYARGGGGNPLHLSHDGGVTWADLDPPVPGGWWIDVDFTHSFEASTRQSGLLLETGEVGIDVIESYASRSTDGGTSWTPDYGLPEGLPWWANVDRLNANHGTGRVVYAWLPSEGLYRSDDYGSTYAPVAPGLPSVDDAVVDPNDPMILFVVRDGTDPVRISTDGGATWSPRSSGLPAATPLRLLMDPRSGRHLLLVFEAGPPWESLDAGLSWTSIGAGPGTATVIDAAWDVAGDRHNIFLATDEGAWIEDTGFVTQGLESLRLTSIAYSRAHGRLFAGTKERGLFALPVSTVATGAPGVASATPPDDILAIAPNPFRPSTTIRFALRPPGGPSRVDVYDAAGRRVRTILDRTLPPGEHAVRWDGRDADGRAAAGGVYFLRLTTPGETALRRAVLLR